MSASSSRNLRDVFLLWSRLEIEDVSLTEIKINIDFQPRNPGYIPGAIERLRQSDTLTDMVGTLTLCLKENRNFDSRAIWLVVIDGTIYVVDGHHRLLAYRNAGRKTIPAKVLRQGHTYGEALLASRLVNTTGTRIALHGGEVREAAWATISEIMKHGKLSWESVSCSRHSVRSICASFGYTISTGSVHSMIKYVARLAEHPEGQNSRWPTWKQARGLLRPSDGGSDSEDAGGKEAEVMERLMRRYMQTGHRYDVGIRKAAFRAAELELERAGPEELGDVSRCMDTPWDDF